MHFPSFPAARRTRAVHFAHFPAAGCILVVHFAHFPAARRALPLNSCIDANSCKELGEVHVPVQENGESARRKARSRSKMTCTSLLSLHEMKPLQGIGRSARPRARKWRKCTTRVRRAAGIWGKCTAGCRNKGKVHDRAQRGPNADQAGDLLRYREVEFVRAPFALLVKRTHLPGNPFGKSRCVFSRQHHYKRIDARLPNAIAQVLLAVRGGGLRLSANYPRLLRLENARARADAAARASAMANAPASGSPVLGEVPELEEVFFVHLA